MKTKDTKNKADSRKMMQVSKKRKKKKKLMQVQATPQGLPKDSVLRNWWHKTKNNHPWLFPQKRRRNAWLKEKVALHMIIIMNKILYIIISSPKKI